MKPFRPLPPLTAAAMLLGLAGCAGMMTAPIHDATYDSFSDSRCPANAKCIWAGRLAFRFIVQGKDGSEEFTLGPDQPVAAPAALRGARVALDLGSVPPARIAAARPSDLMPVTLKVAHP